MFQVNDYDTSNSYYKKTTKFLVALKNKWDDLHAMPGVFRYQIGFMEEKFIEKYLLQLNPNRGTKRRMPEVIDSVIQLFDEKKFNFTKVDNNEILYILTKKDKVLDKHAILVNVSPINRYHSLLCPSVDKCLPQVVTPESLLLVLEFMLFVDDRELKIGFNSLCAFASVNHLHYHIFVEPRTLPVETAKCKQLKGPLCYLENYIVPVFYFKVTHELTKASHDIFKLIEHLLQNSIAHNILITRGKGVESQNIEAIRVFIWPRKKCTGMKDLTAFNVAVCELAGWFPIYDNESYLNMQEDVLECELKKWKYDQFDVLCDELKLLF